MIDVRQWLSCLGDAGVGFYSGVPCSQLAGMFTLLSSGSLNTPYCAASVEGEALAMACGVALGGGLGCVMLQNSGLGNLVNPLTSLAQPYGLPAVLIISWRAQPGVNDAAHHGPMGAATLPLLDALNVPFVVLTPSKDWSSAVHQLIAKGVRDRVPVAIVVPKGTFEPVMVPDAKPIQVSPTQPQVQHFEDSGSSVKPSRGDVLKAFVSSRPWSTFSTTGHTGRQLHALADGPQHFYMQGSMGFASAVAFGWQMMKQAPLIVFDGDGALLMRLGTLATIGANHDRQRPFLHLVLDNGVYASTGGQTPPSVTCAFAKVASACGYDQVAYCAQLSALDGLIEWALGQQGPTLVHLQINKEMALKLGRPTMTPSQLADRFRARQILDHP